MDELYFWLSAVIVGILLLKLLPSEKLAPLNRKIRQKLPGFLIAILYVLIFVFIFIGFHGICFLLSAPVILTHILTGSVIGAFIGLLPIVDSRHSK